MISFRGYYPKKHFTLIILGLFYPIDGTISQNLKEIDVFYQFQAFVCTFNTDEVGKLSKNKSTIIRIIHK